MKKVTLLLSVIILFAVFSAQAQQSAGSSQQASATDINTAELVTVEDDATGSFLIFNIGSGEYKFYRCSDSKGMHGFGTVNVVGCSVTLVDVQPSHRVVASADLCDQQAKAAIEQFKTIGPKGGTLMKEYLSDVDMRDNNQSCLPKK
jgi:hypothetical protein